MSVRLRRPRRVTATTAFTTIALTLSAASVAMERRLVLNAAMRDEARRELRVELQRTTLGRVRLETGGDALATLGTTLDDTRIGILEAVDALARSSRVSVLGHALRTVGSDPYASPSRDLQVLRLSLELEAAHGVRLVEALAGLERAVPGRPVDVAGCRVDRSGENGVRAGARGEAGSLVASCALDWYWWPS